MAEPNQGTVEEVKRHYEMLFDDLKQIEEGLWSTGSLISTVSLSSLSVLLHYRLFSTGSLLHYRVFPLSTVSSLSTWSTGSLVFTASLHLSLLYRFSFTIGSSPSLQGLPLLYRVFSLSTGSPLYWVPRLPLLYRVFLFSTGLLFSIRLSLLYQLSPFSPLYVSTSSHSLSGLSPLYRASPLSTEYFSLLRPPTLASPLSTGFPLLG
ncbi:hypothetical protein VNO80_08203 [Phaseolus coccineus]|uniref:Uncharacterized protein n=1 Tax=Phaseolus coccineus TaxID=3886 RepID=A0AAN9RG09_PHACN